MGAQGPVSAHSSNPTQCAGFSTAPRSIAWVSLAAIHSNSAAGTVITKEKDMRGGSRYLISYNHSGSSVTVTFTLRRPARTISVVAGENRSISPDQSTSFKDTYAPFQAHVYKID